VEGSGSWFSSEDGALIVRRSLLVLVIHEEADDVGSSAKAFTGRISPMRTLYGQDSARHGNSRAGVLVVRASRSFAKAFVMIHGDLDITP
jgi:hypothetical protein